MTVSVRKIKVGEDPSLAVRALLFDMAKKTLSIDMDESDIAKDEKGKPFDKKGRFFFSLSHSDDLVAALIADCPCGTDVQKITSVSDGVLKKIGVLPPYPLSDKERTALWALAESYIKMTGDGLCGLSKVPRFSPNIKTEDKFTKVSSDSKELFEIKEIDGYVLAVCIRTAKN